MIDAGVGLLSRAELAKYSHCGRAARRDFAAALSQPDIAHSTHPGISRCVSTPNWAPAELTAAKSISLEKASWRGASDHRGVKLLIDPMLGFKRFRTAAIMTASIELLRRIHKGQFELGRLCLKDRSALAIFNAVPTAR
jgi:hypothetical protein